MNFRFGVLFCALWLVSAGARAGAPTIPAFCTGTMTLDGKFLEAVWSPASFLSLTDCTYVAGCGAVDTTASAKYMAAWDTTGLYIAINASDPGALYANVGSPWNGSGVEIFFDLNDTKGGYTNPNYNDTNSFQWCITYNSNSIMEYHNARAVTIEAASVVTPGTGYTMEVEIPWANLGLSGPPSGGMSGLDVALDVYNGDPAPGPPAPGRDHQLAAFSAQINPFDDEPSTWANLSYGACAFSTALKVFDMNSLLVSQVSGLECDHLIESASLSPSDFDPSNQSLEVTSGDWNEAYNGKNSQGLMLPNGAYVLEVDSSQANSNASVRLPFTVLKSPSAPIDVTLAPNPVTAGDKDLEIFWSPSEAVNVEIYDLAGKLVRHYESVFGTELSWDLKTTAGREAGEGIYFAVVRPVGQTSGKVCKLAVVR